jgi:hypothetical protein
MTNENDDLLFATISKRAAKVSGEAMRRKAYGGKGLRRYREP